MRRVRGEGRMGRRGYGVIKCTLRRPLRLSRCLYTSLLPIVGKEEEGEGKGERQSERSLQ